MARPVDTERRLEIATGALKVLAERGLAQTSMADIARALGMKRPTLYFYFGSISEIFRFLLDHLRQEEGVYVATRLVGHTHPLDLLEAFLRADLAFYEARGLDDFVLLMCQFWASGRPDEREPFRRATLQLTDPLRGNLVAALEHGMHTGSVNACDPRIVVDLVLTFLDGCLLDGALRGIDTAPLVDAFCRAILDPLRTNPPSPAQEAP